MRIYLKLSPNKEIVPFNYQQNLVGAFHRWLGENELHDQLSLYSLSWLQGGRINNKNSGINFKNGTTFFISAPREELLKDLLSGIFKGTHIRWGMHVQEIIIKVTPHFGAKQRFLTSSPVFIQRTIKDSREKKFYFYNDSISNDLLTETLQNKLKKGGLSTDVSVKFDSNYHHPKTKKITFNNIDLKASSCPVIITGDPESVSFAWNVGIGNSTGIGFGSLQ